MFIPRPRYEEPELALVTTVDEARNVRVKKFLDVPSWKCKTCESMNFGRMQYCVYCRFKG